MSPRKIVVYVLYYGAALAIGFFLGLLQVPETDYYLNGERVNDRLTSAEFVEENIAEFQTKTTVDLDRVPNVFLVAATGSSVHVLPSFTVEGDASTPSKASTCAIAVWILIALGISGWGHSVFRGRTTSSNEGS